MYCSNMGYPSWGIPCTELPNPMPGSTVTGFKPSMLLAGPAQDGYAHDEGVCIMIMIMMHTIMMMMHIIMMMFIIMG